MKKSEIEKIFRKLGLQVRSTGHLYGWLVVNNKKILRVHYSHGKGDFPLTIMQKIRGQLKLSHEDFQALLKCPLSYEAYLQILMEKGLLGASEDQSGEG